jgi:uncharacterized protein YneF (UPF0154 family)
METPIIVGLITFVGIVFGLFFAYFRDRKLTSANLASTEIAVFAELTEVSKKAIVDFNELFARFKRNEIQLEARKIQVEDALRDLKASYIENGELKSTIEHYKTLLASTNLMLEKLEKKLSQSEIREAAYEVRISELESQLGITPKAA